MSARRYIHLVELAHVFAGTPIASAWAKTGAATRRERSAQQKLPLEAAPVAATKDQHLDVCQRCSDPRLDLCPEGSQQMAAARFAITARNQANDGTTANVVKRCFRHVDGFPDISHVEWDGSQMWLVSAAGRRHATVTYQLAQCESFVGRGIWEEWDGNDPTEEGGGTDGY